MCWGVRGVAGNNNQGERQGTQNVNINGNRELNRMDGKNMNSNSNTVEGN